MLFFCVLRFHPEMLLLAMLGFPSSKLEGPEKEEVSDGSQNVALEFFSKFSFFRLLIIKRKGRARDVVTSWSTSAGIPVRFMTSCFYCPVDNDRLKTGSCEQDKFATNARKKSKICFSSLFVLFSADMLWSCVFCCCGGFCVVSLLPKQSTFNMLDKTCRDIRVFLTML